MKLLVTERATRQEGSLRRPKLVKYFKSWKVIGDEGKERYTEFYKD